MKQRKMGKGRRYFGPSSSDLKKFAKEIKDKLPTNRFRGAVAVEATFFFKSPNADGKVPWKRGRKIVNVSVKDREFPSSKPFPDVDNLAKFVNDGMSKFVYDDDVQIVELSAKKRFTNREPRTVITVMKPSLLNSKVNVI